MRTNVTQINTQIKLVIAIDLLNKSDSWTLQQ